MAELAGPIRVGPDGRYFVDANGQPFFWLGDTAWPLFAQYSRAAAERYLQNRADRGFTVIQGVLAWGGGTGFEEDAPGPNAAGDRPWLAGPAKPNPAYFEHVDHLVRFAGERGLALAMLPTWGYYVNDAPAFDAESAYAYGRWLGERYRDAPNVVWVNGGDRVPTGHESVWWALGRGLRAGDGGAHLITYHICGGRSSAQFFHDDEWLDFNTLQTWTEWPQVHPCVLADCLRTPRKPVVHGEGAYENGPEYPHGPITPALVRRQAWWALTAGGFHTYGQDQMWRMAPGWTETFDTPGAVQMGVFKQIATSRPWWKMLPDQSLFAAGVSAERTLNAALRVVDGSGALVYLSTQCWVRLNIHKILTPRVRATFVDPRSGETRDAGIHVTGNANGKSFPDRNEAWFQVPDFWEDAVLLLDGVE